MVGFWALDDLQGPSDECLDSICKSAASSPLIAAVWRCTSAFIWAMSTYLWATLKSDQRMCVGDGRSSVAGRVALGEDVGVRDALIWPPAQNHNLTFTAIRLTYPKPTHPRSPYIRVVRSPARAYVR